MDNIQFDQKIVDILKQQKDVTKQYEDLLKEYEKSDVVNENKKLRKELDALQKEFAQLSIQYEKIKEEAQKLRWSLSEHLLNEKLTVIDKTKQKADLYFKSADSRADNELKKLEYHVNKELDKIHETLKSELYESQKIFEKEMNELRVRVARVTAAKKVQLSAKHSALKEATNNTLNNIKEQPLTEEMIQKRLSQNHMEAKIGLHWMSKIGIFVILIGLITAMNYTFTNLLNDYAKGIVGMVIGIIFLAGGEWFNRKSKKVFAYALIGGGIGTLYITIFSSVFILNIVSTPVALFLAVVVSIITFILSLRYQSKTISSLGLIGGYLPVLAYIFMEGGLFGTQVYVAMVYVLILHLVTLIISKYKDWSILQYISFASHMPTLFYLALWASDNPNISIAYSFITFAMYLAIILVYPLYHKKGLSQGKVVMLALNTFISSIVLYDLFAKTQLDQYKGLLAIVFCLVYFALSNIARKYSPQEKGMQRIYNITALTFAVLIIPFQLDKVYYTMGWLIEAVLFIVIGIRIKDKRFEYGGLVVFGLCVLSFYFMTINLYTASILTESQFILRFTMIILGMCIVLYSYLIQLRDDDSYFFTSKKSLITAYKYFVILNAWIYLIYIFNKIYIHYLLPLDTTIYDGVFRTLLFVIATALVAFIINHISLLYDKCIGYVSMGGYVIADIICLGMNFTRYSNQESLTLLAAIVLALYNILVFLNVKDLLKLFLSKAKASFEVYPLLLSLYLMWNTTVILDAQLGIDFASMTMNVIYIISAFLFIIFGFKYRYRLVRYWGLVLAILSIGKLFLFGIAADKPIEYKLISYFSFGIILLGISYLYQKFSKALEVSVPVIKQTEMSQTATKEAKTKELEPKETKAKELDESGNDTEDTETTSKENE